MLFYECYCFISVKCRDFYESARAWGMQCLEWCLRTSEDDDDH